MGAYDDVIISTLPKRPSECSGETSLAAWKTHRAP